MPFEPVTALLDIGGRLIDKLFPDPQKKAEATMKLMELQQSGDLAVIVGQIELNKAEASSKSLFVSGWRPAVGWTCTVGLATQFFIGPMVTFIAGFFGRSVVFPSLDMGTLMTLLVGMLGLGGMRTVEKLNSVAAK